MEPLADYATLPRHRRTVMFGTCQAPPSTQVAVRQPAVYRARSLRRATGHLCCVRSLYVLSNTVILSPPCRVPRGFRFIYRHCGTPRAAGAPYLDVRPPFVLRNPGDDSRAVHRVALVLLAGLVLPLAAQRTVGLVVDPGLAAVPAACAGSIPRARWRRRRRKRRRRRRRGMPPRQK